MKRIDLNTPMRPGESRFIMEREAEDIFDFSCETVFHNTGRRGPFISIRYIRNGKETDGMDLLLSDLYLINDAIESLTFGRKPEDA
jgi:hypothetical protein